MLTGGYLRPTLYNVPLPRMRNQPKEISMMISKRVKARSRRQGAQQYWMDLKQDLRLEAEFERDAYINAGYNVTSKQIGKMPQGTYWNATSAWGMFLHLPNC